MSGLPIAFPAEAAVPIAQTVIDLVSATPWPWIAAAGGLIVLIFLLCTPVRANLAHAWDYFFRLH